MKYKDYIFLAITLLLSYSNLQLNDRIDKLENKSEVVIKDYNVIQSI